MSKKIPAEKKLKPLPPAARITNAQWFCTPVQHSVTGAAGVIMRVQQGDDVVFESVISASEAAQLGQLIMAAAIESNQAAVGSAQKSVIIRPGH